MKGVHQIELFYFGDTTSPRGSLSTKAPAISSILGSGSPPPHGFDVAGNLELESDSSVLERSSFPFSGDGRTVTAERTSDSVNFAGNIMSFPGPALPSYACLPLVLDQVESDNERIDFTWLTETTGMYWVKNGEVSTGPAPNRSPGHGRLCAHCPSNTALTAPSSSSQAALAKK